MDKKIVVVTQSLVYTIFLPKVLSIIHLSVKATEQQVSEANYVVQNGN